MKMLCVCVLHIILYLMRIFLEVEKELEHTNVTVGRGVI